MKRERQAQLLTMLLLGGALGLAAWRGGALSGIDFRQWRAAAQQPAEPTPQDTVYAMLDAAREGRVAAYLNAHAGAMRASLRQAVAEQGESAFAAFLRQTNEPLKGVALQEPEMLTASQAKLRVEYVFADRNEVQPMYLEKQPSGEWKIVRVDTAERIPTLVPYGTPVR